MRGDIRVVERKLGRAEEHLRVFKEQVAAYANSYPHIGVAEIQTELSAYIVRIHLREQPPASLTLVLGDFLNNLHATLDYLAWQLVLSCGTGQPDGTTYFPILKVRPDGDPDKVRIRITGGISKDALTKIAAVQPYQRGDRYREHPLFILRELNGINKHRYLTVLAAGVHLANLRMQVGGRVLEMRGTHVNEPLEDGAEFAYLRYEGAPPQGEVDMDLKITTSVVIKELGEESGYARFTQAQEVMDALYVFVKDKIVGPLRECF